MSHQRRTSRSYHSKRTSIDLSSILTTPLNTKDILDQVPTNVRRLASPTSPTSQDDNTPDRLAELLARSASLHGGVSVPNSYASPPPNSSVESRHSRRASTQFLPDAHEGSTRILDVSGFPTTYRTQDVRDLFLAYASQMGGFRIKWLNDQRALVVFEHPSIARKAYLDHLAKNNTVKVKPFDGPMDILEDPSPTSPLSPRSPLSSNSTTLGKRRQSRDISSRNTSYATKSPLSPNSAIFTPASIKE